MTNKNFFQSIKKLGKGTKGDIHVGFTRACLTLYYPFLKESRYEELILPDDGTSQAVSAFFEDREEQKMYFIKCVRGEKRPIM